MPTALIAEDEPLLAEALKAELAAVWPDLRVLATVADGLTAVTQSLALQPDVLFFDIRMPGQTGLEAAAELADAWPATGDRPFPALVFVTAYDQYALQAFDTLAVDYLIKPIQRPRLEKCKQKVTIALTHPAQTATPFDATAPSTGQLNQLAQLLQHMGQATAVTPAERLTVIQASVSTSSGAELRLVPVEQVLVFEAADKYIRVLTANEELLIRTPLKDLLAQLDGQCFWQVHRGTVVQATAIARVSRDEAGRQWLHLHDRSERWPVSRLYAHRFKAM